MNTENEPEFSFIYCNGAAVGVPRRQCSIAGAPPWVPDRESNAPLANTASSSGFHPDGLYPDTVPRAPRAYDRMPLARLRNAPWLLCDLGASPPPPYRLRRTGAPSWPDGDWAEAVSADILLVWRRRGAVTSGRTAARVVPSTGLPALPLDESACAWAAFRGSPFHGAGLGCSGFADTLRVALSARKPVTNYP